MHRKLLTSSMPHSNVQQDLQFQHFQAWSIKNDFINYITLHKPVFPYPKLETCPNWLHKSWSEGLVRTAFVQCAERDPIRRKYRKSRLVITALASWHLYGLFTPEISSSPVKPLTLLVISTGCARNLDAKLCDCDIYTLEFCGILLIIKALMHTNTGACVHVKHFLQAHHSK